jgi:hypothetical protein
MARTTSWRSCCSSAALIRESVAARICVLATQVRCWGRCLISRQLHVPTHQRPAGGQWLRGSGVAQSSRKAWASTSAVMYSATLLICKRIYSRSASISLTLLVTCTTFLPPRWRRRTEKGVASCWAAC